MVKNPRPSTSSVLSARFYPTEEPQCSTHIHGSINTITIHPKQQNDSRYSMADEEKQKREGDLINTNTIAYIKEPLDLVGTSKESVYESLIKEMPKCSLNNDFKIKKGDPRNLKIPWMIAINRKYGLMTFTDRTKEITFKMPYKEQERGELSSEGHDLLSSRLILSEDDYDRGRRKPSDLEEGFYRDTIKLGPEYVTGMDDEGEVTKFLIKNKEEFFTDAGDGIRINTRRDLALYDKESWNDPRDFAKPVKAISLPQDVSSTSDRRLIELENQVQRLMEAHRAPTQHTQVNKITTSEFVYQREIKEIKKKLKRKFKIMKGYEGDEREQKQNMEDTMLELLEVCRQKELYCMHNDVDDLIESAFNLKLLSMNLKSKRLDKEKQEVKNIVEQPTKRRTRITESLQNFRIIHKKSSISLNNTSQISPVNAIAPVLPTEEPEYSLSMGYEHLSTTPEMESNKVIKSSVKNLVLIPCEYEGIFDNTCDVPICENSSTFDVLKDHYEILSNSNNDDTSSDDDAFEDIEYVEASLPDSELVSLEEENDVYQEEKEVDLEDIFQIQDVIEKLLSINRLIADIEFLNDNPTPDRVLNTTAHANNSPPEYDSFCFEIDPDQERLTSVVMNNIFNNSKNDPLLEAVDLFLVSDNSIPPGIENIDYDSEGDIHFLEELLSNDSFPLPENKSSNFDHHDDPSFTRPPLEPPDVEIFCEPDSGILTTNVVKGIFEHYVLMPYILPTLPPFDPLYPVYDTLLLFSSENEDKVFKPGMDMAKIIKKRPKPDKNKHEIVKSIQSRS
nr:MAK10-like protein [Tanacetum cinerariifolium]